MKTFVAVDPGITGTGIAYFVNGLISMSGNIYPEKGLEKADYIVRSDSIVKQFCHTLTILKLHQKADTTAAMSVHIEQPAYFGGGKHYTGQTAAESGSLVKLTWHFGRIWQAAYQLGCTVLPVSIQKWKGQLPKDVTHNRIRVLLEKGQPQINTKLTKDHELDAIGIGLFILGFII